MSERASKARAVTARRWALPMLAVLSLTVSVGLVASIGDLVPAAGIAAVVESVFGPGLIALAWLAGAAGLGVGLLRRAWTVGACLGVALMLFVAHLLGVLGLLNGRTAQVAAWAPVLAGAALLAWRWWKSPPAIRADRVSPILLVCVPALAVLIVASCLPAGTIWASEERGYDVLSYHLQLPAEWRRPAGVGRLAPLEHNVYSFLPSYMEAAFMQLDAMIGGPGPGRGLGLSGLAAQMLHALLAVMGAIATGRLVRALAERAGEVPSGAGAVLAAVTVLGVPWVIITGGMAYNEMGVLVCFAGALLAAIGGDARPIVRGLIIGALCGAAVSCKPTAMFLCVPSVAVAILWARPKREWGVLFAGTGAAGLLMLLPWLVRDWLHGGNPVFPFASAVFGTAHWTPEQAARWNGAHGSDTSVIGRVGLLLWTDRGLANPQWSIFAPLTLAGVVICLIRRRSHMVGALLGGMLALMLVAWIVLGHQQSRFLLPMVVPGAAAVGSAAMAVGPNWRGLATGLLAAGALVMCAHSVVIFEGENGGQPNMALVDGATAINGARAAAAWDTLPAKDQQALWPGLGPTAAVNVMMPRLPGSVVYLLGDATPLYFTTPVVYHTTWDRSPIGTALRAGRDPVAALRELGVTHVLINFAELDRLRDDGWYDPDVTPEWARDALVPRCEIMRVWNAPGVALVALPRDAAPVTPANPGG